MFRRSIVDEVGVYSAEFPHAEDYEFWLRIAKRRRLVNLPDVLLKYRIHGKSVSSLNAQVQLESAVRALSMHLSCVHGEQLPTILLTEVLRPGTVESSVDTRVQKYFERFAPLNLSGSFQVLKQVLQLIIRREYWLLRRQNRIDLKLLTGFVRCSIRSKRIGTQRWL